MVKNKCNLMPFGGPLEELLSMEVWSPELSESVDRRSIHQLTAAYKTNKKTTVVSRRPFDGKVSIFLEDLKFRVAVLSIKNLVPFLV